MHFFGFPAEIRVKIYRELLVLEEPIVFVAERCGDAHLSPLLLSRRYELCPNLLRVNKKVHSEAITLLYSENRFQFPNIITSFAAYAHFAPFRNQIGSQASLLRHICISIPGLDYLQLPYIEDRLRKRDIKNLDLIRDACTGLTTLEMSLDTRVYDGNAFMTPTTAETVDVLYRRFKEMPSRKDIIVDVRAYGVNRLRPDAAGRMREYGWTTRGTPGKRRCFRP